MLKKVKYDYIIILKKIDLNQIIVLLPFKIRFKLILLCP